MKILVTAGPTREPIDPVRFISNYSTGAMGYSIAEEAQIRGHEVILVTGPTHLAPPKNITIIKIETAQQMLAAVKKSAVKCGCVIMAAAVSDFRPKHYNKGKLKRVATPLNLTLAENPDILGRLSAQKERRILVGFCMETENLLSNAAKKMRAKNLDIIIANKIDARKTAFGSGKTNVTILGPAHEKTHIKQASKREVSGFLLDKIESMWYKTQAAKPPFREIMQQGHSKICNGAW